ncbi:hypothetical protein [Paraburkholderia sp. BR10954]|uniref:hypothetical protein n=1 Tax=Paraburkholderia sp. BR10954 TaxID=3236995 RepID=UPI0034D1C1AD
MGRGLHALSIAIIDAATEILASVQPTTERSVCYKLFTCGLIANMGKNETAKVSRLLTWARENGSIPWQWIVDETRRSERVPQWKDPTSLMNAAASRYRRDAWQDQPFHIEIVSEKGTIRGVLGEVLDEYGASFRVLHGFSSATTANDIAAAITGRNKRTVLLYLGDWGPSGLYMSVVDLPERLDRYGGNNGLVAQTYGYGYTLERIALTEADVQSGDLPSFPADTKKSDARYKWFAAWYGARCWELDAMDSNALRERVREAIEKHLDRDAWEHSKHIERAEVESIDNFMIEWKRTLQQGRQS